MIGVVLLHRGDPSTPEEAGAWLKAAYSDPLAYRLSFGSEAQKALAIPLAWWDGKALAQKLKDIGGRSPIGPKVTALAAALEAKLNGETQGTGGAKFKVLPGFRYNAPSAAQACGEFKKDGITRIVGVSLYPQQCKRFFASSGLNLQRQAGEGAEVSLIDRLTHPLYIEAVRATITAALERAPEAAVVFSALYLDRSDAEEGDPYPDQLIAAVDQIMSKIDRPHRLSWLELGGPGLSTEEMLKKYRQGGTTSVVLCPLGTIVEELDLVHALDFKLRPIAKALGFAHVERAASISDSPLLIEALNGTVQDHLTRVGALGFVG
jgi:protoporphyrin/coproporphyrin ferrochelatase